MIDPDTADAAEAKRLQQEEDAAAARTAFTSYDDGHGTTNIWAKIPTRHADMLRKALHAIANPTLTEAISRVETSPADTRGAATAAGSVTADVSASDVSTPKPTPQVMGEALCRLLESLDPKGLPTAGGMSATVAVTMTLETLLGGLTAATIDTGTRITPGEARRMACVAGLIPVVLGGQSEILDYGRTRRLHSKPQRAAMAIRQGFRCAAEGCDRPTAWAEAHHLDPWSHGGHTNLDDGVLICGRHHRLAHHPDYHVKRQPGWRISITRAARETPRRQ